MSWLSNEQAMGPSAEHGLMLTGVRATSCADAHIYKSLSIKDKRRMLSEITDTFTISDYQIDLRTLFENATIIP
jgi:hypothetical protein